MMHERPNLEPPQLHSWSVLPPDDDGPGAAGVTDDEQRALAHAAEALRAAPVGARALVHRVTPSFARVGYHYDSLVARGSFEPENATIVWEDLRTSGGGLMQLIPPEALAAGLADVESEYRRRDLLGLPIEAPEVRGQ